MKALRITPVMLQSLGAVLPAIAQTFTGFPLAIGGSRDYYRVGEQTWRRTGHGTWMYFPEGQEPLPPWTRAAETVAPPAPTGPPPSAPPLQETAQSTTGAARRRRRRRRGGRPDPGDGDWDEQAESETLTHDSLVTVSTRHADPRPDPRLPVPGAAGPAQPPLPEGFPAVLGGLDPELPAEHPTFLDQSLAADGRKKGASSAAPSWNSRMGPERGVKWRGGAPPAPPKWAYDKEDLRAFSKYERKVRLWEIQVEAYTCQRWRPLFSFTPLSGEPEQELEHAPLEKINSRQGINYILEQLRGPMSQRLVYQKRRFLSDFEGINRYPSEHLRALTNRYRRTERNLQAVDINVTAMYDGEARGSRLLDRARLSPQDQRLVLVGARYSLAFDDIAESLIMQFPDFKAPPPVMGKDGQLITRSKGSGKNNDKPFPQQGGPSHQGGKGNGKFAPRRVFVTESGEATEPHDGIQDDEPDNDEDAQGDQNEDDPDDQPDGDGDDPGDDLDDLVQVLTVTARRLASVKLGRKFSGNKVPPSELKKKTACAACGEVSHWRGDPQCKVSGTGAASSSSMPGPSSSTPAKKGGKGDKPHQTFTVMHSDLGNYEVRSGYGTAFGDAEPGSYRVNVVFATQDVAHNTGFVGYMVLDTACQRTCCGRRWLREHQDLLGVYDIQPVKVDCKDRFQFGKGDPISADHRAHIPAVLDDGSTFCLGAGVLDAGIPLLASNPLLKALGMVLDLPRMVAYFEQLSAEVPVVNLKGHLAVNIAALSGPKGASLKHHMSSVDWQNAAPELLFDKGPPVPSLGHAPASATMVTKVAFSDAEPPLLSQELVPADVQGSSTQDLGPCVAGRGDTAPTGRKLSEYRGVRPRRHLQVRQCDREIRQVPEVRDEMGVEGRRRKMATAPLQRIFTLIGTAIALLGQ